jgi:hypothetical protein
MVGSWSLVHPPDPIYGGDFEAEYRISYLRIALIVTGPKMAKKIEPPNVEALFLCSDTKKATGFPVASLLA